MNTTTFFHYLRGLVRPNEKFPIYRQLDEMDCGPSCLKMIAKFYGKVVSREFLASSSAFSLEGVSIKNIIAGAEKIKLRTLPVNATVQMLRHEVPLPCIAYWQQRHFVVVYKVTDKEVVVGDPAIGLMHYSLSNFLSNWLLNKEVGAASGILLLLEPSVDFKDDSQLEQAEEKRVGIKLLLQYLLPHKKSLAQLFLGLLVVTTIQLIMPFLTQAVVDHGIALRNLNFIYVILAAQITLFLSRTSVEIIRDWILLHVGSRISIALLSDFIAKLFRLPMNFFETRRPGDLLQRIQDHRRIEQFLSEHSLMMLFAIINLLIFGFVLALFNKSIFWLYAMGTAFYIGWVILFMRRRAKIDYLKFNQLSLSQSSNVQLTQAMSEIKLNNSEKRRKWEWEEIQTRFFKVEMKSLSVFHMQRTGGMLITELKNIFISFVATKAVIDGELTLGTMLSIQYIIGQLNTPIRSLVDFTMAYQDAQLSLERISDIHTKKEEYEQGEHMHVITPHKADIHISNIYFKYQERSAAYLFQDLSITIPFGKVTAIVGESGSGKTTLLKLLLKFYQVNAGTIHAGQINLTNIDSQAWRRTCGVVMQDGYIFADTLLRNITESDSDSPVDKIRLAEAVRIANISDFINSLPSGFNTLLANQGANLSGGQRQRILIARAVYKNPSILFFDEATSALDAGNEKIIMNNLEEFFQHKMVIIIAHRLSTVKNADQILVLEKGAIIELGQHSDLVKAKGKYFSLIKNQLELSV